MPRQSAKSSSRSSRPAKKQSAARSQKRAKRTSGTGIRAVNRHITRLEKSPKHAAGWKVGLMRRGRYMHKHFADDKYGGKTKALSAARAWRDQMVKSTSGADYVLWRREKRSRPSSSGIVGVGRYAVRYEANRYLVWEAYWQDADGKRHSRRFFVSVYGDKGARTRAIATRRKAIRELRQELIRRGKTAE